ncbi:MAG: adenylyl-sulfate kinase [Acidimicrobiales bacterium]|jgi:adenylyl-sulfate kinase
MTPVSDVVWSVGRLTRTDRWGALGTRGATVWFTGLSGSGKSTLAAAVEERLVAGGQSAYRLDGDNIRSGLNVDLDFSPEGREENVRRVAEVALLFADAGLIALAALISPYAQGRRRARALHEEAGVRFIEVYVATPVSVCAQRDPKGFYKRASEGEITSFTGLDHPYEPPTAPDLVVGHHLPLAEAVDRVLEALGSPPSL